VPLDFFDRAVQADEAHPEG